MPAMTVLKIILTILLCVPLAYVAVMLISKTVDDAVKNKK